MLSLIQPVLHNNGILQSEKNTDIVWDDLVNEVWSSPLRRTIQTATIVLKNYKRLKIKIKINLREMWWSNLENIGYNIGYKHLDNVSNYTKNLTTYRNINDVINKNKITYASKYWDPENEKINKTKEYLEQKY